ncbi:Hsp70 family protein, partial [Scytonema sp. UIC 10036]|uniref:Hsp70 family protein n=1 Tax=Scytonema sp. UIC 10036 TaxID=2304196 RepID=UPI001FA98CA8
FRISVDSQYGHCIVEHLKSSLYYATPKAYPGFLFLSNVTIFIMYIHGKSHKPRNYALFSMYIHGRSFAEIFEFIFLSRFFVPLLLACQLVQPFIKRTLDVCDATLKEANLQPTDIDQVLLVGGQTRLPAIKEALLHRYGWKINDSVNPDEAVARGAAVLGARLCGYLKDEVKLWDVTPLSLGIELASGKMDVIIRANEQIPITKWRKGSQAFTTQRDGQESIRFRIYQGERPIAVDNEFVGEVVLNLATARPALEVRVNCMFKVDHDGILHVLAQDTSTDGQPVEKTFDRFYRLTQQEVEEKLKEAEVYRDEDTITSRLFQLEEELNRMRCIINQETNNLLLETLEELQFAINRRDVTQAEKLLAEMKNKLSA